MLMDAFHDLAQMTRDYGLNRYFIMTTCVVVVLAVGLWIWGHSGPPEEDQATPPTAAAPAR